MPNRTMALTLVLGMTVATTSCDPATAVAVPVLVITATWQVEGQEDRFFAFSADQDDSEGLESGTFTGSEEVDGIDTGALTGWWANGQIQFTLQRDEGAVDYSASFNHDRPTRLTFHSAAETIVLEPR